LSSASLRLGPERRQETGRHVQVQSEGAAPPPRTARTAAALSVRGGGCTLSECGSSSRDDHRVAPRAQQAQRCSRPRGLAPPRTATLRCMAPGTRGGHTGLIWAISARKPLLNLRIDGSAKKADAMAYGIGQKGRGHSLGKNFAEFQNSAKGARCTQTGHF
jgi:hypothetical protein